jgi:Ca-activated chloride channel family protein
VTVLAVVALLAVSFIVFRRSHPTSAGCAQNQLQLTVVAAPDIAGVLRQTALTYTNAHHTASGRCVSVSVQSLEAAQASSALVKGWTGAVAVPRPDVWVPDSSMWAQLAELQLKAAHRPDPIPVEQPSIATSPLVVAMPRPMAQAIGWPRRPIGWADLLGALQKEGGWAALGHPEWGAVKLGKTDPTQSTPGLEGVIGALTATLQAGALTPAVLNAHMDETRTLILGLERAPGEQADTATNFLVNLQQEDDSGAALKFVSAVPLGEKQVFDYNQGNPGGDPGTLGEHAKPKVPLVAVYPKEGTPEADHPWLVLNEPWVDSAKRSAASAFLGYLLSPTVQAKFQAAGLRDANGKAGSVATELNGLLSDQPARVIPNPSPAVVGGILQGWGQASRRGNVLAVFDVSGSMNEPVPGTGTTKMGLVRHAAAAATALWAPEDNVGIWAFSTKLPPDGKDYQEIVPLGPVDAVIPGTNKTRRQLLDEGVAKLQATTHDTALYETALAAFRLVQSHYVPGRINTVVLLTDGINDNPGNPLTLAQLLQQLKAGEKSGPQVRVITIGYGRDADVNALKAISQATGGAFFSAADPRGIEEIFLHALANF